LKTDAQERLAWSSRLPRSKRSIMSAVSG
jgi:hypothetical protein